MKRLAVIAMAVLALSGCGLGERAMGIAHEASTRVIAAVPTPTPTPEEEEVVETPTPTPLFTAKARSSAGPEPVPDWVAEMGCTTGIHREDTWTCDTPDYSVLTWRDETEQAAAERARLSHENPKTVPMRVFGTTVVIAPTWEDLDALALAHPQFSKEKAR